jgi:hypothetical protein
LSDDLEARLVWIFGSPRTGSTWLLRMLCHPHTLDRTVPLGFEPAPATAAPGLGVLPVDELFFANHLAPAQGEPVLREDGSYRTPTLNEWRAGDGAYLFASRYEAVWRENARRLVLDRLDAYVDVAGVADPLLAIKEVNGSHAADLVMSLFPRSRLLLLFRDGRDVVDSLLDAMKPGGWASTELGGALETDEARLEYVRSQSRAWAGGVDASQRAADAHTPELTTTVRYEDLLADPAGRLAEIVAWLGRDPDSRWIDRAVSAHAFEKVPSEARGSAKPFRAARPGLWRESLTDAEQRAAAEIMGERLTSLGYAAH